MPYQILGVTTNNSSNTALGITLPFIGSNGSFLSSTYTTEQQALSNLKNLLLTVKGERVQQPTFGTDLVRLLFEPNTDIIKQNISDVISRPVNYWLPYINIIEIKTITADDDPNLDHNVSVTITFSVTTSTYSIDDNKSAITLNVSNNQITITDTTSNGN